MARNFKGQVHVRIPPKLHEEVAQEAFQKGTSISGICAQALVVRNALQGIDPWKSIEASWTEANRNKLDPTRIEADISEAISAVRRKKQAG